MSLEWQQALPVISALLGIISFLIGVYQLRKSQPHPLASMLFLLLGIAVSLGSVIAFLFYRQEPSHRESRQESTRQVPRYVPFATVSDISDHVTALTFTQDGRLLVIGTGDGKILIWSTDQKKIVDSISAEKKSVAALSFTADGGLMASSGRDGTAKLWDFSTRAPEAVLKVSRGGSPLAFSPNVDLLAQGVYNGLALYKVDRQDPTKTSLTETLPSPESNWPSRVVFDPDGSLVALLGQCEQAASLGTVIRVWDTKNLKVAATLTVQTRVHDIAVSRNGLLAADGEDKVIRVWGLERMDLRHTLMGHSGAVSAVAFRPDDDVLASGGDDLKINLWDAATGKFLETVGTVEISVSPLVFSPDNGRFLAAGAFHRLVIWVRSDAR